MKMVVREITEVPSQEVEFMLKFERWLEIK
jgi:hypothetical protein